MFYHGRDGRTLMVTIILGAAVSSGCQAGSRYDPRDRDLVWKIYDRALDLQIGDLETLGGFDLEAAEVRRIMAERTDCSWREEEIVISPAAMYRSASLETVHER